MELNFMTPDVWDGLVIGSVLIGLALAVLRLMNDRSLYRRQRSKTPPVMREDTHTQDQP